MCAAAPSKKAVTRRRTTSGSLADTSVVESTRSTNIAVASLRSTARSLGRQVAARWAVFRTREALSGPTTMRDVLDPKVFKAYDVRGIHGTEIDEDGAYRVGRAYVEQFEPRTVAIGRDMRVSSPTMAAAVIEGVADAGADVIDIGMVGTEMLYYAVGDGGLDGGICVTASHNPKEFTGM